MNGNSTTRHRQAARPLRVALISEHASPLGVIGGVDGGGQNVYVAQVAQHLVRQGHAVDVFTRRDAGHLPLEVVAPEGYRVIHVEAGPASVIRKEELLPHMGAFTEFVCRYVRQHGRYDIVHANFWMSGMTAQELKRRFGIPFVITFHALGKIRRAHQGDDDGFAIERLSIEESLVRDADRVIAECPQDEFDLLSLYAADASRLAMIPCGYEPAECAPVPREEARAELGLPQERPLVLQLGRLVPRKGIDNVVRAFASTHVDVPEAALLIAGGETPEPDPEATPEIGRLSTIARSTGIEDAVHFVGRRQRDELKYWYSAADLFVTTPWYEPFGITPVEAMACGTPVIGSRVGGIQYTVVEGLTGLLVPPKQPRPLAEAMTRLLTDHDLRQRFAENGIVRARELFTWEQVTVSIAELYQEVAGETHVRIDLDRGRRETVRQGFDALTEALRCAREQNVDETVTLARSIADCLGRGGKLLICGNGGSAADAEHLAGELVGRFRAPGRRGLPAIVLGAELSSLTAWANDVDYESAFARQVEAFGAPGDVLLGISTSGRSRNIVRAFEAARRGHIETLALLGGDGGDLLPMADAAAVVPVPDTQRIQEVHGLLIHLLCELIEQDIEALDASSVMRIAS